jgi:hypothetical protein
MQKSSTMTRRYSTAALPPYRYVPGESPHPVLDPLGHSYGVHEGGEPFDADRWSSCATYLVAIDLFNFGYYWEAHEELERLWRGAGRRTDTGVFLQGLIQVAAALLKHSMGRTASANRLAAKGCTKLRTIPEPHLGICGPDIARRIEASLEGRAKGPVTIRLEGLEYVPAGSDVGA